MKKLGMGSIMNAAAAVLGVVGVIATYVCSSMNVDNAMVSLPTCIVFGIVGIVLCVAGIVLAQNDLIRTVAGLGAIAAFMYVVSNLISERVMLVAGLFSYAQGNQAGWQVFYVTIVAAAALILGCVSLIVGAFGKAAK